jgi:large subunit ribosomal protein L18
MTRKEARQRRHRRLRAKVAGTAARPRMAVCVSDKHIYVQFIDDSVGHTLVSVSSLDPEFRKLPKPVANVAGATQLGKMAAERALAANIREVVFDRGGFTYHGRVKAVADAARQAGLVF